MKQHISKVAIIGAGLVGSSTAFSLLTQGLCDEILLVDRDAERAHGEMMDLRDGIDYLGRNIRVTAGGYAGCGDADIVVITAGPPPREGQTRLDTLGLSKEIVRSIVGPVMEAGFSGIFLIVSNPVDLIAQDVWKLSGLPKSQVIGTGTALDSARLKALLGGLVGVDPRSVHAFALGEHGDSQMVPWSRVTVGGKTFAEVLRDNPDRFEGVDLDRLVHDTVQAGWEILEAQGYDLLRHRRHRRGHHQVHPARRKPHHPRLHPARGGVWGIRRLLPGARGHRARRGPGNRPPPPHRRRGRKISCLLRGPARLRQGPVKKRPA